MLLPFSLARRLPKFRLLAKRTEGLLPDMTYLRVFLASLTAGIAMLILAAMPDSAQAHPHVFVEARAKVLYDDAGKVVAIRHVWRFDDAFSAFAIQGLDTNKDGTYTREELAELAKVNIDSLGDFAYFTFGDDTKVEIDFNPPQDYWLELHTVPLKDYWALSEEDLKAIAEDAERTGQPALQDVKLLELHFTLPLKEMVGSSMPVTFDVYDPTYYVDFQFAKADDAIQLSQPPGKCSIEVRAPKELDAQTAEQLAAIGAEVRDLPPELRAITETLVNQFIITCGTPVASAPASDAVNKMAQGGSPVPLVGSQDSQSQETAQSGNGAAAPAPQLPSPGIFSMVIGKIAALQSDFYQRLVSALRRFQTDPNAVWFLLMLSFAYGVFHAAGPGHGKAIITSYMFANEATMRRGIVLSFAAAFVQATTAVLIVTIVALALQGTSIAMKSTLGFFESASYGLVALLGGWLVYTKLRAFLRVRQPAAAGHGHDHHHDDDESCCGHSHGPDIKTIENRLSLREAAAAVFSIGMRPCSGALVVLVFALSQGLYFAGVASAYVMAVGTALTISTLAIIAVTSKGLASRILGAETRRGRLALAGLEVAAAGVVLAVGLLLLVASIQAPTTL